MAYQNVGTPRFYVNALEWLVSIGVYSSLPTIFKTLPVIPSWWINHIEFGGEIYSQDDLAPPPLVFGAKSFVALLGHEINSPYQLGNTIDLSDSVNAITYGSDNEWAVPNYLGWSLHRANFTAMGTGEEDWYYGTYGEDTTRTLFINFGAADSVIRVGSIMLGTYYDMPHSPDLKLTMSREYGGTKTIETNIGATLSNTMWTKPPNWGQLGAWELGADTINKQYLQKSGRRVWDLSFSYLKDSDVFPELSSIEPYESTSADGTLYSSDSDWHIGATILDDDDFFSQVWHRTLGMTLPFIFQPDGDNNNPDQFAIVKGVSNSLKITQSAFNVYDISLKLEEVW